MKIKDMRNYPLPPGSRLTVIGYAGQNNRGLAKWLCRCECGNEAEYLGHNLRSGQTTQCRSCKYLRHGRDMETHGYSNHPLYRKWARWSHLGELCDDWKNFETFLADVQSLWSEQTPYILRKRKDEPFCHDNIVVSSNRFRDFGNDVGERLSYNLSDLGRLVGRGRATMSARWKKSLGKCVICLKNNHVEDGYICASCAELPQSTLVTIMG